MPTTTSAQPLPICPMTPGLAAGQAAGVSADLGGAEERLVAEVVVLTGECLERA